MLIKDSFNLLFHNLNLVFKQLLFIVCVALVAALIYTFACAKSFSVITKSAECQAFIEGLKELWVAFINGNLKPETNISDTYVEFNAMIRSNFGNVVWAVVVGAVLIYAVRWFIGLSNFAIATILNEKMTSMAKKGFLETLLTSFKKGAGFEALYALIDLFVLTLILLACLVFVVFTVEFLFIFSFIIAVWLFVSVYSIFLTAIISCRMKVVRGESVKSAFKHIVEGKYLLHIFASHVVAVFLAMYFNITMFFATVGAGLVVSLSATSVYYICMQAVATFAIEGSKYYVDYDTIVTPNKIKNEKVDFLDDVGI